MQDYYKPNEALFGWRTFRQVIGDSDDILNKLRGVSSLDVFYKMPPRVLSLMHPKLRIYKVTFDDINRGPGGEKNANTSKTPTLVPCYREFRFSDSIGQEAVSSVKDYLSYESTKPNWRNIGLRQFTFTNDGGMYGAIEQNLKCELNLVFKSLKDLTAQPPGEPPPERGGLRYADLILHAAHSKKVTNSEHHVNPRGYRLKVLMGYSSPSKEQLRGLELTEKEIENISKIEKLNLMISLDLLDYAIDIQDDGQVNLRASYRGGLDGVLSSSGVNIFEDHFNAGPGKTTFTGSMDMKKHVQRAYEIRDKIRQIHSGLQGTGKNSTVKAAEKLFVETIEKDGLFAEVYLKAGGEGVKAAYGKKTC